MKSGRDVWDSGLGGIAPRRKHARCEMRSKHWTCLTFRDHKVPPQTLPRLKRQNRGELEVTSTPHAERIFRIHYQHYSVDEQSRHSTEECLWSIIILPSSPGPIQWGLVSIVVLHTEVVQPSA